MQIIYYQRFGEDTQASEPDSNCIDHYKQNPSSNDDIIKNRPLPDCLAALFRSRAINSRARRDFDKHSIRIEPASHRGAISGRLYSDYNSHLFWEEVRKSGQFPRLERLFPTNSCVSCISYSARALIFRIEAPMEWSK